MPRLEPAPPARSRKVPPVRPQPTPDDDAVLSDHAIRAIEEGRADHAAGAHVHHGGDQARVGDRLLTQPPPRGRRRLFISPATSGHGHGQRYASPR